MRIVRTNHRAVIYCAVLVVVAASVACKKGGDGKSVQIGATEKGRNTEEPAPGITLADVSGVAEDAAKATAAAAADPIEYGWKLFVFLDWPAKSGTRGVPDPTGKLGSDAPVVWETWKEVHRVYLEGGKEPDAWNDGGPSGLPILSQTEIDGKILEDTRGNAIAYTTRMNKGTFEYILQRKLYGYAGQVALRKAGTEAVRFPTLAMEIKASWRILDPVKDKDAMERYLVRTVLLKQGQSDPVALTVGLTGLHISSRALPNWVWLTFEQVDNLTTTGAKALLPMDPAVASANQRWHTKLAGTRFAYYKMMGAQTAYTDGTSKQPTLLANTQIETYFQKSSSCITCHALASIGPSANPRFEFFKLSGGNLEGYVGDAPTAPFGTGANQYTPLDFVWSLREAKQAP